MEGIAQAAPQAGWYLDPEGNGHRYWNGSSWTGHIAPPEDPEPEGGHVAKTGDWIGGVLLSLMLPLVGLIAGIVYVARGGERARCGWMCIGLSLAATLVVILLAQAGSGPEPNALRGSGY